MTAMPLAAATYASPAQTGAMPAPLGTSVDG